MKPEPLRALLDEHADPARAHDVARYLKLDTREVLGVPVPTVHETAVGFVRAAGLPEDPDLLDRWFAGSFEEALCAVFFMGAQPWLHISPLVLHRTLVRGPRYLGAGRPHLRDPPGRISRRRDHR